MSMKFTTHSMRYVIPKAKPKPKAKVKTKVKSVKVLNKRREKWRDQITNGFRDIVGRILGYSPKAAAALLANLSPRQREVASMIAEGSRNGEVAKTLDIAQKTVEIHIQSAKARMGLRRMSDLVRIVYADKFN